MPGHVGHHLRLTALRIRTRPQIRPPYAQGLRHEFTPRALPHGAGQRRNFSAADGVEGLLRCSHWLMTNSHELTGAPWCVSIPLAALLVNAVIRTPITFYLHQRNRRAARLGPLIQAQMAMVGRGLRRKGESNTPESLTTLVKARNKKLATTFAGSVRGAILGSLATLPIFISNLEVIRRMCGGPKGLLGSLVLGVVGNENSAETAVVPISQDSLTASTSSEAEIVASPASDIFSTITLEPTFATEGCLWFPNLLESDPLHILPFALSAIIVAHMLPETTAARRELFGLSPVAGEQRTVLTGQTSKRRAFQRTLLVLAFAMGPITMDMPAALHLYWISSAGFSLAVAKGLRWALPIPKNTIKQCRGMEIPLLRPKPTA